jgi:uncharacterized protein (TIGR01777 family)
MRVLISGSRGLIGSALVPHLRSRSHTVTRLVRSEAQEGEASWDPAAGQLSPDVVSAHDAVIHLSGEPIIGRWNAQKKEAIRASRVETTKLLSQVLAGLSPRPRVLVSASAVGFYGDRGDEVLDESSPAGRGFLAEVGRDWEEATRGAEDAGVRVVHARIGIVLSREGGALKAMLPPFRVGLGGALGSGDQWWSWISLPDILGAFTHAIETEEVRGAVNFVGPQPQRGGEVARTLGRVLRRPATTSVPAFALRLAMGEAADEILLASQRALPRALEASGYTFRFRDLEEFLRVELA